MNVKVKWFLIGAFGPAAVVLGFSLVVYGIAAATGNLPKPATEQR